MSASSGRPYWDQRDSAESTWQQILHGKPSGTFVVRMSKSSGVEATITMVKAGGGGNVHRQIISAGGDGGGVAVLGSKHTHTSITALVKFYQDPKYFAQEEDYGTIYAGGAGGGTLEEQQLYERIVDESAYAICDPYNPLDQLGRTPMMPLTKAVAVLAKFVKGNATADCKKALQYAKTHPQLGKVQRPGGAALTVDDIAAIYMYTMPTNFYGKMNEELGGYGKDAYGKVEHFLPITKLLVAAFEKLPPVLTKLFRGVKMNYKDILKTPGVANIESLKSKWFLPHFSRNQTVDFLRGKPHGSFVIRKSSFRPELEAGGISDPNSTYYAISMKKRDRELWNGLIMHSRGFYTCVLKGNTEFRYNDLSELVHGLIHNQDLISVAGFPERVRLPDNGTNPFGEPENFTAFSSTPAFAPTTVANGGATSGFDEDTDIYDEPEEENSDDNFDV
eukprot:gene11656-13436_t